MTWPAGLDLRALNVFLETARAGNMTEAAKRLGMTQPAVSQYISKAEEEIGAQLLDRSLRPIRLTPAGEVLRDRAEALMVSAEAAVAAARNVGDQPLAALRIGVPNSLATTLTPWLYDKVMAEMRPGNFALRAGQSGDHVRALMEREVDLIIATDAAENLGGIVRFELLREPFMLMLPAGYDHANKALGDIVRDLPLIRFAGHNVVGQMVERHLRRIRVHASHTCEFDTAQAVAAMVAAGHGFAVATPMCVLEGAALGYDVVTAPLPGPAVARTLHVLARGHELGQQASIFARICRDVLTDRIRPLCAARMPWIGNGFRVYAET
jgi:DNA-binding transcriptional LysR family regulator